MKCITPASAPATTLEQLLCRADIWRGQSRSAPPQLALDTGFAPLNQALLNGGWPLGGLIDVCQQGQGRTEWLLLTPALRASRKGYWVLLNPPHTPFAPALLQAGLDLERLLIVETGSKTEFLASFKELARCTECAGVLAWQPKQSLSYTDQRKCLLAASEGLGLYLLFSSGAAIAQSSPAVLRIRSALLGNALQLNIIKQKGQLQASMHPVLLPLPSNWQTLGQAWRTIKTAASPSLPTQANNLREYPLAR